MSIDNIYLIFLGISSITSAIAIIIIIYDRIIDERKLRNQVQSYYESIEKLIFSNYQADYIHLCLRIRKKMFEELQKKSKNPKENYKDDSEYKKLSEEYNSLIDKRQYYKEIVKTGFKKYKQYLGLVFVQNLLMNNFQAKITESGYIWHKKTYVKNCFSLNNDDINRINNYMKGLRIFWKEYYRIPFIRPKLKGKKMFTELFAYKKPLEKVDINL